MIPVNRSSIPPREDLLRSFNDILDDGLLTNNGPYVRNFEDALKKHSGCDHVHVVANGTLGLQMAIRALDLQGDIITTPFSFIASSSSIIWGGCTPVFADILPDTLCIDPASIESLITDQTVAIMAVHIYGNVVDIDEIERIAQKHDLKTIYDGAHAYGSRYKGQSCTQFRRHQCFKYACL